MRKSPCIVPTSVSAICNDGYSMFAHDTDIREEGVEQGIEIGLQKGAHDKAVETARKMLEKRYDINEVAEITGLSVQQLAVLAQKPS